MNALSKDSVIDLTRIPLDATRPLALSPWVASPRETTRVDLDMQVQCLSSWCWAAVAASISEFYAKHPVFAQCDIANLELGRKDCCTVKCGNANVDPEINTTSTLGSALFRVGCLAAEIPGEATRDQVLEQLEAGRPICVRTVWSTEDPSFIDDNAGAHFVVIVGFDVESDILSIADSLFGPTPEISFEQFRTHYQTGGGTWRKTYYTSPPADRIAS
jgi:hypothetical protein